MEISGKVIQVLPLQGGTSAATGNPWQLKTFIIETLDRYPVKVAIEIFGEQRIKDNPAEVDQLVTASVDIESREYNGRWYTSIRAWKVAQGVTAAASAAQPVAAAPVPAAAPVAAPVAPAAPAQAPAPAPAPAAPMPPMGDNTRLPF